MADNFKRLPQFVKVVRGAQPDFVPAPPIQKFTPILQPHMAAEFFRPVFSEEIREGDDGQIDIPDRLERLMEEMIKERLRKL